MSELVNVTVECFGALESSLGDARLTLAVGPPHTVAALIQTAQRDFPGAADLLSRTACARGDQLLAADEPLREHDTIALIPPVSGGQCDPGTQAHLTDDVLDLDALLDETDDPACGALVVFGGTVRLTNNGRNVESMDYSAYGPLAARTLADIERETIAAFDIHSCRLQHRTGRLTLGEVSVYVVVRAIHRDAAFEAARHALEQLKARVAVWKNEYYADGSSAYLEGTEVPRPERPVADQNQESES
ncbi:molybdenum cofactor biosynthesis protein MoaE [Salinisphaera sp. T31B1]|uniref:molybdenum cofactor biosynthesis protein n=1 Tax=Salinisphaera sp. T31B1 TaxID=727963 RepID=UPI00333E93B1